MGVPKFFRYISERYPCLSEIVKEHQIPQFDNLYLDMNGIIHTCSHPEDDDPHFRISEEKIFLDIFHYIEVLFRMIKPRKLFFMAVDGVAPRAKMNQQRARRFRSAKDAEKLEEKARKKGEVLPTEARFDSNCITPGTEFMARLHEQLKYFIVNKISTDKLWRQCKIILSGHETPGEGEHKIMDYIRYMRAQPDHDPNTRHCLYGLDADLIMLGLCTHEPHFSLLREEVKFGRKSTKRKSSPEEITFFLLHLSLMREYLEMEFKDLENDSRMAFSYDIEKIIDDWVLMGFLVGNDFIPNLPNLHIANGALPILYQTYVKVLPTFDGYINEAGTLNLTRFEKFMQSLASIDLENFQEQYADIKYFEMKTGRRPNEQQRKSYKLEDGETNINDEEDFIQFETDKETDKPKNAELEALIQATVDELFPSKTNDKNDADDDESKLSDFEDCCDDSDPDKLFQEEFTLHKKDYYANKLDYKNVTPEVFQLQAEGYVRAIQWNLNYYYNGVCSWSWFYPHHYAPFISDIKGFSDLNIEFDLGKPFFPYEQLLAVLPEASKNLLPESFRHLMTDENSLIKDYYPEDFETDLNGKRAEWEAVVLIPFIDEQVLLEAMKECHEKLTFEEIQRNKHGPMLIYCYTSTLQEKYEAVQYFPTIEENNALCSELTIDDIRIPKEKLVKGAYPGVKLDIYFPGFPTTKHLKYSHHLHKAHVKVHEQPSRNESIIIKVKKPESIPALDIVARELLGNTVYVAWPHLIEARVVTVSNKEFQYHSTGEPGQYNVVENKGNIEQHWNLYLSGTVELYRNRFGIEVGETEILVHVNVLIGRRYMFTRQGRVTLEKQWAPIKTAYPLQVIVKDISVHDETYSTFRDLESVFPAGSSCFMLGHPYYGCMGEVKRSKEAVNNGRIKVSMQCATEPNFDSIREFERTVKVRYMNSYEAAVKLAISRQLFTRVTGSILVSVSSRFHSTEDTNKINIGLNLKFSKKNEEIPGYTKRENKLWLYSDKAVQLVKDYNEFCPKLFEYLNRHNENVYYVEDIFSEDNGREKLAELSAWIKVQPYYMLERRACGTHSLEPEVVKKIEEIIDSSKSKEAPKEISMKVKPYLLFKPDLSIGNVVPDPTTKYQLYDRVVNVRECYTVPLGLRGTIIALHKSEVDNQDSVLYDVVFDEEFVGGLSLNCSANRGYRLPKSALINKSHGQREFEQKSGKPGELTQKVRTSIRQQVDAPQMLYPPQHSAFVPCPPGNIGPPMYMQHGSYMYRNTYNGLYIPPHSAPVQPFSHPSNLQHPLPVNIGQTLHFMPQFSNNDTSKNNTNQHTSKSQYMPNSRQDNRQPSVEKRSNGRQAPKIDSNYLKKILKITPDGEANREKKDGPTQVKAEDIFTHAKNKPLAPIQPKQPEVNANNTVKLLSYYQSNGLGCPHYNFFDLPDRTIQAQLINPLTGGVTCGKPSASKLEACENIASEILAMIESHPSVQPPVPLMPQPPKNWRQQQNKTPVKNERDAASNSKAQSNSIVTSPFVPLQAVKSHLNKNASTTKNKHIRQNSDGSRPVKSENTNGTNEISKPSTESTSSVNKPFRKRKMRIAANFNTNFATKFEE